MKYITSITEFDGYCGLRELQPYELHKKCNKKIWLLFRHGHPENNCFAIMKRDPQFGIRYDLVSCDIEVVSNPITDTIAELVNVKELSNLGDELAQFISDLDKERARFENLHNPE